MGCAGDPRTLNKDVAGNALPLPFHGGYSSCGKLVLAGSGDLTIRALRDSLRSGQMRFDRLAGETVTAGCAAGASRGCGRMADCRAPAGRAD